MITTWIKNLTNEIPSQIISTLKIILIHLLLIFSAHQTDKTTLSPFSNSILRNLTAKLARLQTDHKDLLLFCWKFSVCGFTKLLFFAFPMSIWFRNVSFVYLSMVTQIHPCFHTLFLIQAAHKKFDILLLVKAAMLWWYDQRSLTRVGEKENVKGVWCHVEDESLSWSPSSFHCTRLGNCWCGGCLCNDRDAGGWLENAQHMVASLGLGGAFSCKPSSSSTASS